MKIAITRRWLVLGTGLFLSLAATGWLAAQEGTAPAVVQALPARGAAPEAAVAMPPDDGVPAGAGEFALRSADREPAIRDLFAATTWQLPQQAAAAPLPPPVPMAPSMPFVYLGKMIHAGEVTVFLAFQDRNFAVKEGEVVDGSYRIDSIKGPVMTMTYLPLETQQTLHIGDQN